jgi:hypothetical protein
MDWSGGGCEGGVHTTTAAVRSLVTLCVALFQYCLAEVLFPRHSGDAELLIRRCGRRQRLEVRWVSAVTGWRSEETGQADFSPDSADVFGRSGRRLHCAYLYVSARPGHLSVCVCLACRPECRGGLMCAASVALLSVVWMALSSSLVADGLCQCARAPEEPGTGAGCCAPPYWAGGGTRAIHPPLPREVLLRLLFHVSGRSAMSAREEGKERSALIRAAVSRLLHLSPCMWMRVQNKIVCIPVVVSVVCATQQSFGGARLSVCLAVLSVGCVCGPLGRRLVLSGVLGLR